MTHAIKLSLTAAMALALILVGCSDDGATTASGADQVQDSGTPGDALDDGALTDAPLGETSDITPSTTCKEDEDCLYLVPEGDPCATASCRLPEGVCVIGAKMDGYLCDDGSSCTSGDRCVGGTCLGVAITCDDGNDCTDDSCDPATGCTYAFTTAACDDGTACTSGDTCVEGVCVGATNECGCSTSADCGQYEDATLCNGSLVCDGGVCVIDPASVVACAPLDNPCAQNMCDPTVGKCFVMDMDLGTPCDDGDPCTDDDMCVNGACKGTVPTACDDDNPCTTDVCDPTLGCTYSFNALPCDDGNPCTLIDVCTFGTCLGKKNACPCTSDGDCDDAAGGNQCVGAMVCDATGSCVVEDGDTTTCEDDDPDDCVETLCDPATGQCQELVRADGAPCDDHDVCTLGDLCVSGTCLPTGLKECKDGNPCTVDACDPTYGCLFDKEPAGTITCNDGDPCTGGETCLHGLCAGTINTCECLTDDDCTEHEDGNLCNGTLMCLGGLCAVDPSTVVVCDDFGTTPCKVYGCIPATGECKITSAADGTHCDDGNACTEDDACQGGACVPGSLKSCDDPNPCIFSYCDAVIGCVAIPQSGPCEDGDLCTVQDVCSGGVCIGMRQLSCEEGDTCTTDQCDPSVGCLHTPSGALCDDGDMCTVADSCGDDGCVGEDLPCDDGNPCTADACTEEGSCLYEPLAIPCEDGNYCTVGDTCSAGACVSGEAQCSCDSDLDCASFDDGDLCNGGLVCQGGTCVTDPSTIIVCDQTDAPPCKRFVCMPQSGLCQLFPSIGYEPCDDDNACTTDDHCAGGECVGGPALACEDGNVCTDEACDPTLGCVTAFNAVACEDGNPCSVHDYCFAGECISGPELCDCITDTDCIPVDDGNVCNGTFVCGEGGECVLDESSVVTCDPSADTTCLKNTCDPQSGVCAMLPVGLPLVCTDSSACTMEDSCQDGLCTGTPVSCDDDNQCTADLCEPSLGCLNLPKQGACDDGDACTEGDTCVYGECVGVQTQCDDGDPCTDDVCTDDGSCSYTPGSGKPCDDGNGCTSDDLCLDGVCTGGLFLDGQPCSDGDVCTKLDVCAGGMCVGSEPLVCDDGNQCTDDSCDQAEGCKHVHAEGSCDDGNLCTEGDTCVGGVCLGATTLSCVDDIDCTDNSCDPLSGCVFTPRDEFCDDANDCTQDTCDVNLGCVHTPTPGIACVGADPCLLDGTCDATGQCVGTTKTVALVADGGCDDQNPCTIDDCSAIDGSCVYVFNAAPCDDGDVCTTKDICENGICIGYETNTCNDGDPCTADTCDPLAGCVNTPLTGTMCNDGDACTQVDQCVDGACVGSSPITCEDGNPCTANACDPALGCTSTPLDMVTCDDGDQCTTGETCAAGVCQGGTAISCDDTNDCTADSCDPQTGCVYIPLNGTACDDGNVCTQIDQCLAGSCAGSAPLDCDDTNPCTQDSCDPILGCQTVDLDTIPCEDGDACTYNDTCTQGVCTAGLPVDCNDNIGCTLDSCNPLTGFCESVPDDASCDDFNECTTDYCVMGATPGCLYVPMEGLTCDDGNLCTTFDECDSSGLCNGVAKTELLTVAGGCDTGDPCIQGTCDPATGACGSVFTTTGCDDTDPCTTADTCDGAGLCGGTLRTTIPMAEGGCDDGNVCTTDQCDPVSGFCTVSFNTDPCDDGDACTIDDTCDGGGKCVGVDKAILLISQGGCDDGLPCTEGVCTPITGVCIQQFTVDPCDDGDPCTTADVCDGNGTCAGSTRVLVAEVEGGCDDGNPCTVDSCELSTGICGHTSNVACGCSIDDDCIPFNQLISPCAGSLTCQTGFCQIDPITVPVCADDGNICTTEYCDPTTGLCDVKFNTTPCDDTDPCTTNDTCIAGTCLGGFMQDCDDGAACSLEHCEPMTGCQSMGTLFPDDPALYLQAWDFDDGSTQGWNVTTDTAPVTWQADHYQPSAYTRYRSPGYSLYMGDPTSRSFDVSGSQVVAIIQSTLLTLPSTPDAALTFWMWNDTFGGTGLDVLSLWVIPDGGTAVQVWTTDGYSDRIHDYFKPYVVDLSAYKGQMIQLEFRFDSGNAADNLGEGIYLDDLVLSLSDPACI